MKGIFKDFFEAVLSKISVYLRSSVVKKRVKKQSLRFSTLNGNATGAFPESAAQLVRPQPVCVNDRRSKELPQK